MTPPASKRICGRIGCLKPAAVKSHSLWRCSEHERELSNPQTVPLTNFIDPPATTTTATIDHD